jgi:hypothetical protein
MSKILKQKKATKKWLYVLNKKNYYLDNQLLTNSGAIIDSTYV